MKEYAITDKNLSYYIESIGVTVAPGASLEERQHLLEGALEDAEMDISIDWGDNWQPSEWENLHFDYSSPKIDVAGVSSTMMGWLDLRGFEKQVNASGEDIHLVYTDAWGQEQDKMPLCIHVYVNPVEED